MCQSVSFGIQMGIVKFEQLVYLFESCLLIPHRHLSGGLSREGNASKLKHFIFEAHDVRASHRAHVRTSKMKGIFDHVLQKQLATNVIKSQHHRKATVCI